jgi:hypothetical protein
MREGGVGWGGVGLHNAYAIPSYVVDNIMTLVHR